MQDFSEDIHCNYIILISMYLIIIIFFETQKQPP